MNTLWKRYRVVWIAGAMTLSMAAGLGAGIHWSGKHVRETVVEAAGEDLAAEAAGAVLATETAEMGQGSAIPWTQENRLYKEAVGDEEIVREVCSTYGLDYDTVLVKDVSWEMRGYEEALWLAKYMGDCPLFGKGTEDNHDFGLSSLEGYLCDIYAFGKGADVIKRMCEEFEIDPDTAVIADLKTDQIVKICNEAYETSDHPKE